MEYKAPLQIRYVNNEDLIKRMNKLIRGWILIALTTVGLFIIHAWSINKIGYLSLIIITLQTIVFIIAVIYLRKAIKFRKEVTDGSWKPDSTR